MDQRDRIPGRAHIRCAHFYGSVDDQRHNLLSRIRWRIPVLAAQVKKLQFWIERAKQRVHPTIADARYAEAGLACRIRCCLADGVDRQLKQLRQLLSAEPNCVRARQQQSIEFVGIRYVPRDRFDLEQRQGERIEAPLSRSLQGCGRAGFRAQDGYAPHCAAKCLRIDSGAPASSLRASSSGASVSPQSNTMRSSTISLPLSLNSCARNLRSPPSMTQNAATGDAQVAPKARVNARSAITQS